MNRDLKGLRINYKSNALDEVGAMKNPMEQFVAWLDEALHSDEIEPNGMTLSSVDEEGNPSSRIVLLKETTKSGFIFFTNYESKKGKEIEMNPKGAILFWWKMLFRQVRVEGIIEKISAEESFLYFKSRPVESQIGATISPQSKVIKGREVLEEAFINLEQKVKSENLDLGLPNNWGGYILKPTLFEFWQGRESRLHDRVQYSMDSIGNWKLERLAP